MLRKNTEIVYDKKFFIEYAHNEFSEGNQMGVKKYRKYQEKRRQEEDEKITLFSEQSSQLKNQMNEEENQ